ncbi:hypothetical protein C8R44DRAFT_981289 [Mycena epipterygia]|nr:hypothetical protein C8R44DRAFT_981289 [Mycena epipterygia]
MAGVQFTAEDEENLVKYIAKDNPDVKGRCGSTIYILLCQNEHHKWWSSRHSWASWRSHYLRKKDEFNKRIEAYQTRKNLSTENPVYNLGSSSDDDSDDTEESQRKRKCSSAGDARKRAKIIEQKNEDEDESDSSRDREGPPADDADEENEATSLESDEIYEVPAPAWHRRPAHFPEISPNPTYLHSRSLLPRSPAPTVKEEYIAGIDFVPPIPTNKIDAASRQPPNNTYRPTSRSSLSRTTLSRQFIPLPRRPISTTTARSDSRIVPRPDVGSSNASTGTSQTIPGLSFVGNRFNDITPVTPRYRSLFSPRTSPATSPSAPATASGAVLNISSDDRALIEHLGLQHAIAAMAKNHGFDTEVVRNVYAESDNLAETDQILLLMRKKAEEAGQTALHARAGKS